MRKSYGNRDNNGGGRKRSFVRKKVCRFCTDRDYELNYKNPKILSYFITERGKIIPRRITGTCAFHQRSLTTEVKRARMIALIPYTATHTNYA